MKTKSTFFLKATKVLAVAGLVAGITYFSKDIKHFSSKAKASLPMEMKAKAAERITICHELGNGDYISIIVDESSLQAHLDHGDFFGMCDGDHNPITEKEWMLRIRGNKPN